MLSIAQCFPEILSGSCFPNEIEIMTARQRQWELESNVMHELIVNLYKHRTDFIIDLQSCSSHLLPVSQQDLVFLAHYEFLNWEVLETTQILRVRVDRGNRCATSTLRSIESQTPGPFARWYSNLGHSDAEAIDPDED